MKSIRQKPGLILAVAVMLFVSFAQPPTALALPEESVFDYYYSGCGTLTYLGEEGVDCDGFHPDTYNNSIPYKWRWHYEEVCWENDNCGEFCQPSSYYVEKCQNGTSKYVTPTNFWAANCSC